MVQECTGVVMFYDAGLLYNLSIYIDTEGVFVAILLNIVKTRWLVKFDIM